MPRISVVMPAYNSEKFIANAIKSVINQTYTDWECLIVNEYGGDDGTASIVEEFAAKDPRIRLIQNRRKLGLAESINKGIRLSKGEYIARLDTDDTSHPDRLRKQIDFMDTYSDIGVLGTWQHHYGKSDWIHAPARCYDKCQAILLFDCNMCHSTVMIRKAVMMDNAVFYDPKSSIEDFKLWSDMMRYTRIANLPEVLGEYMEGEQNISNDKMEVINEESARVVALSLKRIFDIDLQEDDLIYFSLFKPALYNTDILLYQNKEERLKEIIDNIFKANRRVKFCNDAVMMHVLHYLWVREHTGYIAFNEKIKTYDSINNIFFIDSQYTR